MKKRKLPKSLTTVTTFSKYTALSLFIIFPVAAFFFGMWYQRTIEPPITVKYSYGDDEVTEGKRRSIDNVVSVTAPDGWKKETQATNTGDIYVLSSPNYNKEQPFSAEDIEMLIKARDPQVDGDIDSDYQELSNKEQSPDANTTQVLNVKKGMVGTYPTVSYQVNFEGYRHIYYVYGEHTVLEITIYAKSAEDEQRYQSQINQTLNSLSIIE